MRDGEFMVLVGPSGCGKSTLLKMIAGVEEVTEGASASASGRDRCRPASATSRWSSRTTRSTRRCGSARTSASGSSCAARRKREIRTRVADVAQMLGLEETARPSAGQLSGGQRQRVAMGRAIVREPKAFLMDEPLSNLDAKLRVSMRPELARLHERLGVTTVYVTHDQVEAMTLGHRVAVLRDGVLQQCDTPDGLFHAAANLFVAAFIGSPAMNLVGPRSPAARPGSLAPAAAAGAGAMGASCSASARTTSGSGPGRGPGRRPGRGAPRHRDHVVAGIDAPRLRSAVCRRGRRRGRGRRRAAGRGRPRLVDGGDRGADVRSPWRTSSWRRPETPGRVRHRDPPTPPPLGAGA